MKVEEIKYITRQGVQQVIAHRRHLHRHPELSFQEFETVAYVRDALESMGIPCEGVTETGLVGIISGKRPGRTIALRADMDALPITEANDCAYVSVNQGVMHACGHDVHTASLLGVAQVLMQCRDQWDGQVKLIFQPGEEKLPGGASLMIKAGVLKSPEPQTIFGQHVFPELPAGTVGFRPGAYMASADEIYLRVKGKGGHAALPHLNVDPVSAAAHVLVALQTLVSRSANPLTPSVLSFGKLIANGATNVIPDEVLIEGTFRTFDENWRQTAHEQIHRIAASTAAAHGARCDVDIRVGYPHVYNNEPLTLTAMDDAREFLGADRVVNLDKRMTAEDFSFYGHEVAGCFYRLGTRNGEDGHVRNIHTATFDVDESSLETGVGLMTWLCLKALDR